MTQDVPNYECLQNYVHPFLYEQCSSELIEIDYCLAQEIKDLWARGIVTKYCCCGHGDPAGKYLAVREDMEKRMLELGYERHVYNGGFTLNNVFTPKSITCKIQGE